MRFKIVHQCAWFLLKVHQEVIQTISFLGWKASKTKMINTETMAQVLDLTRSWYRLNKLMSIRSQQLRLF